MYQGTRGVIRKKGQAEICFGAVVLDIFVAARFLVMHPVNRNVSPQPEAERRLVHAEGLVIFFQDVPDFVGVGPVDCGGFFEKLDGPGNFARFFGLHGFVVYGLLAFCEQA